MLMARIALLGLSTTVCYARAAEKNISQNNQKIPELLELLGNSNIVQARLDGFDLIEPLESLVAPAFQVGILDTLEKFVRALLDTLTGLDELSHNDMDFFRDLDGTSTLINMLENIHRTAEGEQPNPNWNMTIGKLLDDMQYEIERLPDRTRQDASDMVHELREASDEKIQLQERSGNILERMISDLTTQVQRISNSFGARAVGHISKLGGAGIFQMISEDINSIVNDPRMQTAPREILERIIEIGKMADNQRDQFISNRSFPFSLLESWQHILHLPLEVLQVLDRTRSELLGNLFSVAATRLNSLGAALPILSFGIVTSKNLAGNLRSSNKRSKEPLRPTEQQSPLGRNITIVSRSAELLQDSAAAIAGALLAPVNLLLSPLARLGRDSGSRSSSSDAHSSNEPSTDSPDVEGMALLE